MAAHDARSSRRTRVRSSRRCWPSDSSRRVRDARRARVAAGNHEQHDRVSHTLRRPAPRRGVLQLLDAGSEESAVARVSHAARSRNCSQCCSTWPEPAIHCDSLQEVAADVIDVDFGVLEGAGFTASAARQAFAQRLAALSAGALLLSDRFSMKHFSHTDRDLQAVVA